VSARLVYPVSSLHTIFWAISTPQERSANGLLEAVNVARNVCGDNSNKLIGITTDGESTTRENLEVCGNCYQISAKDRY